jgi:PAS domain S-box-containing protein
MSGESNQAADELRSVSAAGSAEADERFRLLVEGVKEYAIFMLDPHGHIVTWNSGAERIKGYTADEIIGQHFSKFYPPAALKSGHPQHELDQAAAAGKYEEEGWRLRKDGSRFWANVVITALRNEDGTLRGFAKVTRDMTEQKRAEENARRLLEEEAARRGAESKAHEAELARREERRQREQLLTTLSSIGDAVIVTDPSGVISFMNPVAEALTGWSSGEAAGQLLEDVFRIVNEHTRQVAENPVKKVIRLGSIVGLANHTKLLSRTGQEFLIDDSGAPIRGDDGNIEGVVLVFRDVTESRRATQARLQLAAIVESSDDAIISKNLDGIILTWNRAAERLYGYTAQEILGKPLALLIPPEHPDELPSIIRKLKRGERIEHFETVRVRKDGSRVNVSLTISPLKDQHGEIIGASKIARDITARKHAEEAARFLADASRVLSVLLDPKSTMQQLANVAVPRFADWCAVDMLDESGALRRVTVAHVDPAKVRLAHDLYRRYPPDPRASLGAWNIIRTGNAEMLGEIPDALIAESIKDKEGRRMAHELGLKSYIGVPLSVRGKVLGIITFVTAESGKKYTPFDLRLAEDLGQRAATAIENARLYEELKMADQRKDEFLAMLAHELRNPLAPIRNALHIMKNPEIDSHTANEARDITERQVQHMSHLVDDLLDVSRIMQGRIELRKEVANLPNIIDQAVETAQPIIDAQRQKLEISMPDEPIWLEVDPTRIAQVIANLLQNAAKYSQPAGCIWLTVQRDAENVVIRVRDEGMGISAELLPRVFDLFAQGDRTLERSQGGLGVGLTVVRRLVAMHGGHVTARSEGPGKGSEFIVRVPLSRASEPAQKHVIKMNGDAGAGRHVLVVDDNVDAARSTAMLLSAWGHTVRVAHNGPEALAAAAESVPEIIVLDIGLPVINGFEVARQLRQQSQFDKTIVAAVTGYGQAEDRRRSRDAGFDYHLTKPVDITALKELMTTANRRSD